MLRTLTSLTAFLLLFANASVYAQSATTQGSLMKWVAQKAAPEMTRILGKHPKFKGQRIRFSPVQHGQPVAESNKLIDSITQTLSFHILRHGNNDIANPNQPSCAVYQANTALVITVEVTTRGSRLHRVNIAVLDVEAGAWVSGIAFSWQGRLQSQELRELKQPSSLAHLGSHAKPIAGRDVAQLATTLFQQARCHLPNGVAGSVFVNPSILPQQVEQQTAASQSIGLASSVAAELTRRLAASPGWIFSPQKSQARWQLDATWRRHTVLSQLIVQLTPINPAGAAQHLASVYVEPPVNHHRIVAPKTNPPAMPPSSTPTAGQTLLSPLTFNENSARCKAGQDCVDIHFDLHKDGYVLVFQTLQGRVNSVTCQSRAASHRDPGSQTYRLNLSPTQHHQRVGFYVIGTRSLTLARQLTKQIRSAPGNCGHPNTNPEQWLKQTAALLRSSNEKLEWQALHLQLSPEGFAVL